MKYAMSIKIFGLDCVEIRYGDTPFPLGAVWPVVLELPVVDMVIENGVLREKTEAEKQAYRDATVPQSYAVPSVLYGQPCVDIKMGVTPFPEGSVCPVTLELPVVDMVIENGVLREKTVEEKQAYRDAYESFLAQQEIDRQAAKPLVLRRVENNFLTFCDLLTGTTTHTKLGFDVLEAVTPQAGEVLNQLEIGERLLAIDAEGKREGGIKWWDDCVWHPEIAP